MVQTLFRYNIHSSCVILLLIQIKDLNMGMQAIEEHFLQANCKADYILIHKIEKTKCYVNRQYTSVKSIIKMLYY